MLSKLLYLDQVESRQEKMMNMETCWNTAKVLKNRWKFSEDISGVTLRR